VKPLHLVRYGVLSSTLVLSGCGLFDWFHFRSDAPPHVTGSLSVAAASEFAYAPAEAGRVSPNRIENTAVASIVMKKNIDVYVREAVVKTLHRAGLDTADDSRVLSARIETFSVDDVRSPATWTLALRYSLVEADTKRVLYTGTKTVSHPFRTFTNNTFAIEDVVKANVAALLADPAFVRCVH